jgi:hypothetical protein
MIEAGGSVAVRFHADTAVLLPDNSCWGVRTIEIQGTRE